MCCRFELGHPAGLRSFVKVKYMRSGNKDTYDPVTSDNQKGTNSTSPRASLVREDLA